MHSKLFLPLLALVSGSVWAQDHELPDGAKISDGAHTMSFPHCRCAPGQSCWPSDLEWSIVDRILDGALIKTEPIAQSCYPGKHKDLDHCAYVYEMWTDQDFMTSNPIGRPYPYNITCAPVNYTAGAEPTSCILGASPVYAVNATSRAHIREAILYSRLRNLRLVTTGTGHDLLGRSDGYGGLELWLHHFKHGIDFQEKFKPQKPCSSSSCRSSDWKGSAIKINGNYQWFEVYEVAKANNVIAVGGGSISPGAIGGWSSGGGHGPATRNYGLGADQILEAEVMLANGTVVIASPCENVELYRALRGGGPGYGVTLSATIKVYPNIDSAVSHKLAIAPKEKTELNADLLDAVATILTMLPDLNDGGFSGYGYWFRNFPTVFVLNATSGYTHGIWTLGMTKKESEKAWAPIKKALSKYSDKLIIQEVWETYTDYWSFYEAESGLYDPTGDTSVLTSRLMDRPAVSDYKTVRDTVETISGDPQGYDTNVILMVSGGKVFEDANDKNSGLNPAWRRSPYAITSSTSVSRTATVAERQAANDLVTYTKGGATKKLAPNTGGYMNEGDRNDPDWKVSFYGDLYEDHLKAKKAYDPYEVFFCPTCVGSDGWVDSPDGPLCRA